MELNRNIAFDRLFKTDKRYVLMFGGRGSGKSYEAAQDVIENLVTEDYFRCVIARQNFSDIRGSQFQQIKDVIADAGMEHLFHIRENTMEIECKKNGNKVIAKGFKASSGSATAKMKSITEVNYAWIEEADEVGYNDFTKFDLSLRTTKGKKLKIVLSYNTENEDCWLKTKFHDTNYSECEFIHTTYHCNIRNLHPDYVRKIESLKELDYEYYRVVVMGQWGSGKQGKIFTEYDSGVFPTDFTSEAYGLDFGFTNDPTALVHIRIAQGKLYVRELIYGYGLTNHDIGEKMKGLGVNRNDVVYADSAEPKSIEEIYRMGLNVKPTIKGADSINQGIQLIKQYPLVVCDSPNMQKELKNYVWAQDKNGNLLNKPIDAFNHCFHKLTPVLTVDGYKPIHAIKVGENIINSCGVNKVVSNGITGYNTLWEYKIMLYIGEVKIICTENHLFKTTLGWKTINEIQENDWIYQCKSSMGKYTDFTQESDILVGVEGECIPMFGNTTMAKYLKGIMSIIKMKTRQITELKIWKCLKFMSIYQSTEKIDLSIIQSGQLTSTQKELKLQKTGIKAQLVLNGIGNTLLNAILGIKRMAIQIVKFVVQNLRATQPIKSFAQINANQHTEGRKDLTTSNGNAQLATLSKLAVDTQPPLVAVRVLSVSKKFHSKDYVWDLTIDKNPEFIANGLLVHNCIDATRYAITGLKGLGRAKVLAFVS